MTTNAIIAITSELSCAILSFFIWFFLVLQKERSKVDKDIQTIILLGTFLLFNDALAYITKYNSFSFTYYLVRTSNFCVFAISYILVIAMGKYFADFIKPNKSEAKLFKIVEIYAIVSLIVLVISQFTNFYYYFDEFNIYHRTKYYPLCQTLSVIALISYSYVLLKNKNKVAKNEFYAGAIYIGIPAFCSMIQAFVYGFPLLNIALVVSSWILFMAREMDIRNQLEEAICSKDEFLSNMSHDLRTPLNGILGILEINARNEDNKDLVRENRKKAKVAAEHLLSLLNDVLELSKLDSKNVKLANNSFSMYELLNEVETISKLKADDYHVNIICDYKKEDFSNDLVYGSPLHIKQILLNIVDNAIKYNKENGSVFIKVVCKQLKEDKVEYTFTIKDTGIGMSNKYLEHIFEPFSQEKTDARSVYKGTGLGMSIVKNLIELMHGNIYIDSKVNEGSIFLIKLPFNISNEEYVPIKENKNINIAGKRILVVEDNDLNREIVTMLLIDKGVIVSEARDGLEALETFKNSKEHEFDLILMDIMMPVMDGYTASKEIRKLNRSDISIPIIALTANAFLEDTVKSKEAGMNDHLSKPFKIEELANLISKYCK